MSKQDEGKRSVEVMEVEKRRGVWLSVKRRRKYKKKSLADGSILSTQRRRKLKEIQECLV